MKKYLPTKLELSSHFLESSSYINVCPQKKKKTLTQAVEEYVVLWKKNMQFTKLSLVFGPKFEMPNENRTS